MKKLVHFNLLFLEDNKEFARNMVTLLELYFKTIYCVSTITEALEVFDKKNIHVIMSDIKVEDGNGLDFIAAVRERDKNIPIIVLSAHKDESFLLRAIPLGLSDYLIKPIAYIELQKCLTKIEQMLERSYSDVVPLDLETTFNRRNREIVRQNHIIPLAPREAMLLGLLIRNSGVLVSKMEIQCEVYGDEMMSEAALKNLVLRLRKKIGQDRIVTVSQLGYKFHQV